uniref:Uncharacterized protein n=1 Tax=Noctiluca scintillans TaxID=2966 RepID=A0A7S1F2X0_NOCSC
MEDIVNNPERCPNFEPNVFKKEKCKHCGLSWKYHKGVIAASYLQGFMKDGKAEAEAKAKDHAKTRPVKKAPDTAAEDTWYFDDGDTLETNCDSDDEGFRMLSCQDFETKLGGRSSDAFGTRQMNVTNLINFDECNVPVDTTVHAPKSSTRAEVHTTVTSSTVEAAPAATAVSTVVHRTTSTRTTSRTSSREFRGTDSKDDHLLQEIQYFRQMLADSNEEKAIQVAIIQEDLALARAEITVKKDTIIQMTRERAETERLLQSTKEEMAKFMLAKKKDVTDASSRLIERRTLDLVQREADLGHREEQLDNLLRSERKQSQALHNENAMLKTSIADLQLIADSTQSRLIECESQNENLQARVTRLEAPHDALLRVSSPKRVLEWDKDVRENFNAALSRLADRNVELRVASALCAGR